MYPRAFLVCTHKLCSQLPKNGLFTSTLRMSLDQAFRLRVIIGENDLAI